MNYFVVLPGGQEFGPATVDQLTQWASEGRITRDSIVRDSMTGAQQRAGDVPGIIWVPTVTQQAPPVSGPYASNLDPQPYAQYPRPGNMPNQHLNWLEQQFLALDQWILYLIAFFLGTIMLILSIITMATTKDPTVKTKAKNVVVFCVAIIVISCFIWVPFAFLLRR